MVSNTNGTTATSLIDMLCEGKILTLNDIKSVYHRKLSASPVELLGAYRFCRRASHSSPLDNPKGYRPYSGSCR